MDVANAVLLGTALTPILIQTILGMSQVAPYWRDNKGAKVYCSHPKNSTYYKEHCIITDIFCEKLYSFEESPLFCQKANGLSSYAFLFPVIYACVVTHVGLKKQFLIDEGLQNPNVLQKNPNN